MSFLLFLRGLVGVLVVFAITTFYVTGSAWTTFVQTAVCAVLLQVGYFIAVLIMIWRSGSKPEHAASKSDTQSPAADPQPGADPAEFPTASRSRNS